MTEADRLAQLVCGDPALAQLWLLLPLLVELYSQDGEYKESRRQKWASGHLSRGIAGWRGRPSHQPTASCHYFALRLSRVPGTHSSRFQLFSTLSSLKVKVYR